MEIQKDNYEKQIENYEKQIKFIEENLKNNYEKKLQYEIALKTKELRNYYENKKCFEPSSEEYE